MIRSKYGTTSPKVQEQLRAHQATATAQADAWFMAEMRHAIRFGLVPPRPPLIVNLGKRAP